MAEIRTQNLLKKFGTLHAVDDLNYTFVDGKVTCLLGPSGCGKTTLLRMIGGLETVTSGSIFFDDRDITSLPTNQRNIGMVFQYAVVYRGLSVEENIALPLKRDKVEPDLITERVEEALDLLDLSSVRRREAWRLPSVTRQKIAVARQIARRPDIILFDEPLTNLDANAKTQFKRSFKAITQQLNQTIVYVTHDQTEAMTLGDHIALMKDGKIVQYDEPRSLYNYPQEVFGGWFLGNPGMNFFSARIEREGNSTHIVTPLLPEPMLIQDLDTDENEVILGIRPEHIMVSNEPMGEGSILLELQQKWIVVGGQYLLTATVDNQKLRVKVTPEMGECVSERFFCSFPRHNLIIFNKDGERIRYH